MACTCHGTWQLSCTESEAQDIQADYLQMYDDYFDTIEVPKFKLLDGMEQEN